MDSSWCTLTRWGVSEELESIRYSPIHDEHHYSFFIFFKNMLYLLNRVLSKFFLSRRMRCGMIKDVRPMSSVDIQTKLEIRSMRLVLEYPKGIKNTFLPEDHNIIVTQHTMILEK